MVLRFARHLQRRLGDCRRGRWRSYGLSGVRLRGRRARNQPLAAAARTFTEAVTVSLGQIVEEAVIDGLRLGCAALSAGRSHEVKGYRLKARGATGYRRGGKPSLLKSRRVKPRTEPVRPLGRIQARYVLEHSCQRAWWVSSPWRSSGSSWDRVSRKLRFSGSWSRRVCRGPCRIRSKRNSPQDAGVFT
jgi:hypothetical protein